MRANSFWLNDEQGAEIKPRIRTLEIVVRTRLQLPLGLMD
jgi:hypothetical protein